MKNIPRKKERKKEKHFPQLLVWERTKTEVGDEELKEIKKIVS